MAWTFVGIVDEGRVADVGDKAVHQLRGTFTDGEQTITETTFFYSLATNYTPPTNPMKAARRDEILARLNAEPEERDIFDEYLDKLRYYYIRARRAGNTKNEILIAVRNCFLGLIGEDV